ncbi:FAD-dependent oxidoreductase [Chitinophaga sedimenti]|uniref:FAD-dependent oxidoreductase n=1 Tax=Chitinophaga sedimenti TaxID=2033606 RepID=UPI0027DF0293|nr:FAD-dependent oxidoreductase [Chitinophaga sedimenti]
MAFGSTRVMRTCGMMGEVVGYAAYIGKKNNTSPRGVYEKHLSELMNIIKD